MKKSKKKWIGLAFGCVFGLLIAAAVVVYALVHSFYSKSNYVADDEAMEGLTASDETEADEDPEGEVLSAEEQAALDTEMDEFADSEEVTTDGQVYNVLLIGVDRRDRTWAGNSDAMILLSLNYEKKQISMISLMRDTYVDIPGIGKRKLNAAHANGAGPLLLETVEENFKIDVDRYVSVDFVSLREVIDEIGGVELTLSDDEVRVANGYIRDMCDQQDLDYSECEITSGGTHTYSGIQAVGYARIRYVGNSDYERTERQRKVILQILEKMKEMSVTELYSFAETCLPLVTHNIPEDEIWGLLSKASTLFSYDIVSDRIPYDGLYKVIYVNSQDMLVPDWEETVAKLKETLY